MDDVCSHGHGRRAVAQGIHQAGKGHVLTGRVGRSGTDEDHPHEKQARQLLAGGHAAAKTVAQHHVDKYRNGHHAEAGGHECMGQALQAPRGYLLIHEGSLACSHAATSVCSWLMGFSASTRSTPGSPVGGSSVSNWLSTRLVEKKCSGARAVTRACAWSRGMSRNTKRRPGLAARKRSR